MKRLAKVFVLGAALTVGVMGLWTVSNAAGQQHMLATPFIAAEQPESPKFSSNVVSTGKRNPFSVTAKSPNFSNGKYSGVIIESQDPSITPRGLDTVSFLYKGAGEATIEYTGPQMVINRATASFGSAAVQCADGFKKMLINTADLGIPPESSIHKIVIAPPPGGVGRMLVDEITLNGDPVNKALHTAFYKVTDSSTVGPLAAVATGGCTSQATTVTLKNRQSKPVQIYFTLGRVTGCIQNVQQVFPSMQIVGDPVIGTITLNPSGTAGDSITSNISQCYSGSFSAESVRINCATDLFPNGQSLAEFIVNNGFQGNFAQETVDISCVAGSNALWRFNMSGGQSQWSTTTDTRVTPNKTQQVSTMHNDDVYHNYNLIGVFPFGCTNCGNNDGVPCCAPPIAPGTNPNSSNPPGCAQQGTQTSFPPAPSKNWNPNPPVYGQCNPTYAPICNVQRPASCNGGSILIEYMGRPNGVSKTNVLPKNRMVRLP